MVTLTLRNIKQEKLEEVIRIELHGYVKEGWAGNQETQRIKYDGTTLKYYKKGNASNPWKGSKRSGDEATTRRWISKQRRE